MYRVLFGSLLVAALLCWVWCSGPIWAQELGPRPEPVLPKMPDLSSLEKLAQQLAQLPGQISLVLYWQGVKDGALGAAIGLVLLYLVFLAPRK
jgi:hypothetical protein